MSMAVLTNGNLTPPELLEQIFLEIQTGHIKSWSICEWNGEKCLTPSLKRWKGKACLKPCATREGLRLACVLAAGMPHTVELMGICQGRFAEMLYTHDAELFHSSVAVVAMSAD